MRRRDKKLSEPQAEADPTAPTPPDERLASLHRTLAEIAPRWELVRRESLGLIEIGVVIGLAEPATDGHGFLIKRRRVLWPDGSTSVLDSVDLKRSKERWSAHRRIP